MDEVIDFKGVFARLAATGEREHAALLGGVSVRLVRVPAGSEGRFDRHDDTAETVVVWSGTFDVAFRENTLHLGPGQTCVVPVGADHHGTSKTGAEVILYRAMPAA